jgi:hypothetical protein
VKAKRGPDPDDILPGYDSLWLTNSRNARNSTGEWMKSIAMGPSGIRWEEVLRGLRSKSE